MADMVKQLSSVSPFNKYPEVIKNIAFSSDLTICDCTLRDGEQQAGVVFTKEDKITIAKKLEELGIPEIEVGMPAVSDEDKEATRTIVETCTRSKITALARPDKSDIDLLANCNVWCATLSIPIGDMQREYKLKWDDDTYVNTVLKISEYAKKKGLYVNFSPYDTTRVNQDFLERVLSEVVRAGTVDRVRLVDTVGSAHPLAIQYLVRYMKNILGKKIKLEIHCHDDFGLATACTLAAAEAGAEVMSTTMNGLGERAGNAPTEEVLVALRYLYGVELPGIDLTKLCATSRLVEELSGVTLQQHKAVVGRHAFSHESGMVVAGVYKMPFVAEAYAPETVGQKREILIGKKSGTKSILKKLEILGCSFPEEKIRDLLESVKALSIKNKRTLTDEEFMMLVDRNKNK